MAINKENISCIGRKELQKIHSAKLHTGLLKESPPAQHFRKLISTDKPPKKELRICKREDEFEFDDALEIGQEEMRDLDEGNRVITMPNDSHSTMTAIANTHSHFKMVDGMTH